MKSLALYVDKWYIVGAHCGDGDPQPLHISNGDDRIWLYFYNDREANRVSYSSEYKGKAFAGVIDYYKDIFPLIPTEVGATYKRFGRNVEMKDIFSAAGIFDDLHNGFPENEAVKTYISFSPDISPLAQSVFLDLLKEHKFEVSEYVAHIGHLTIEYAYRHEKIKQCSYVLLANACNENLRFALYQQADNLFVCRKEKLYEGLGIDLRKRALLEQVIENLESASRFICNEDDRKEEYNYLGQYVDEWIKSIDSDETSKYMPVSLGNFHLKKQQGNNYPISIMRSEIDNRTSVIIEDIVGAMMKMLSDYGIGAQNVSYIVFLGNAFENSIFEKRLVQQTALDASHILHFREERLSEIVSVYSEVDCTQFSEAEDRHKELSEAEKVQLEQAKHDREALEEARIKEESAKAIRDEKEQNLKKLNDAIEYAQNAERNDKIEEALGFYKDALALAPGNQQILDKVDELGNYIAEIRSKRKQYNEYIDKAKQCIDDKDWEGAKVQSKMALGVMPKSPEAEQILAKAEDMGQRYIRLKERLTQIDTYIEQGAYDKALETLHHAETLGLNDPSIEERKTLIVKKQKDLKELIEIETNKLETALNNEDFEFAIQQCELLFKIDANNQSHWAEKKATIASTREKVIADRERFDELKGEIDKALLNEEWDRLEILCVEALKIKNDDSIQEKKNKAIKKKQYTEAQRLFDDAKTSEDWKRVIEYSTEYPFLKENRDNNRIIQYARRQLQFSRNKGKSRIVLEDEFPINDITEPTVANHKRRTIRPKEKKSSISSSDTPMTLLQEPTIDISIDTPKKRFPRPKKIENKDNIIEDTKRINNEEVSLNPPISKKRKFPKVSHNKK